MSLKQEMDLIWKCLGGEIVKINAICSLSAKVQCV